MCICYIHMLICLLVFFGPTNVCLSCTTDRDSAPQAMVLHEEVQIRMRLRPHAHMFPGTGYIAYSTPSLFKQTMLVTIAHSKS
jgi:hypothetical protein